MYVCTLKVCADGSVSVANNYFHYGGCVILRVYLFVSPSIGLLAGLHKKLQADLVKFLAKVQIDLAQLDAG